MSNFLLYKFSKRQQYVTSLSLVLFISGVCYLLSDFLDYKIVAFLLLVTVSLVAMFFDIIPVLLSAILSTVVWNFFFIPPKFTFAIHSTADILLFLMYFIIVLINAALTYKIRQVEKKASKKEEKENTLKLYNTVLNSLSHELRTPISTIIGATDTLLQEIKLSEENKQELISEISKAGIRLNRQVGNLLNMSRLESGVIQPKMDWCDVSELVYSVIKQLQDVLHNKPVHVAIPKNLPLFKIDYGLMEQVLYNLVHNAAVYIPKYAVITVRIISRENSLILVVEDTGNGFPEAEMGRVFEKFYRLNNSTTGGTGLGLSIVKGFVEAMHGSIRLQNREESGAKFAIEIPAQASYINTVKE